MKCLESAFKSSRQESWENTSKIRAQLFYFREEIEMLGVGCFLKSILLSIPILLVLICALLSNKHSISALDETEHDSFDVFKSRN